MAVDVAATAGQRRGWYLYGWASQTFPTVVTTVVMSRYPTSVGEDAVGTNGRVHVLGVPIPRQPVRVHRHDGDDRARGAHAPGRRHRRPHDWYLGAALYAVAFLGYSCSILVSYSLLIDLSTAAERDRVSSVGWALAYVDGGTLLAASFATSLFVDKPIAFLIYDDGIQSAGYVLQAGVIWQFFALAVVIALVLGGSQALSRSLFSRMMPAGAEAEYFAFYEVSGSDTSWLGPLVFGRTYQNTGSYRGALASLVIFFVVGFVLLLRVPVRRAVEAVGNGPRSLLDAHRRSRDAAQKPSAAEAAAPTTTPAATTPRAAPLRSAAAIARASTVSAAAATSSHGTLASSDSAVSAPTPRPRSRTAAIRAR